MKNHKRLEPSKRMTGKGNPRYIDGRSLKKKYCQDCGKLLNKTAFSCGNIRCYSCCNKGKNNPAWKGDKVGYSALHEWIRNRKPKPEFCEICKKNPSHDLANISGEYKRDVNDFEWLCRSCHIKKYHTKGRSEKMKEKVKLRKRDKKGRFIK